jgi:precorrin-6A/cobalt-precorrin-6A reductase
MPNTKPEQLKILLLGGTSEAAQLAERLSAMPGVSATLSLAGRTASPRASALPVRVGGFGGAAGLEGYLKRESVDLVIDATHPFAANISNNAVRACETTGVSLIALDRPAWPKTPGDDWEEFDTVEAAIAALPKAPQRVFSGLGRSSVAALCAAPQHHYVIRVVDEIAQPRGLSHATIIAARGPFRTEDDTALFQEHAIQCVLAKNAGGSAAYAKIAAARKLGLKVYMIRRPAVSVRPTVTTIEEVMERIAAHHSPRAERGV